MPSNFLQVGKSIKMEINMTPSSISFQGKIEKIEKDKIIVKINGKYVQKEPQIVNCVISDSARTKICLFETIIKYGRNDRVALLVPDKDKIKITQRREYARVPMDEEANCYLVGINDRKIKSDKIFPARVKDIGGGGVLLNSTLSLPIGTVLVFEVELDGTNLLLTIKVITNIRNEDDGTRNMGCKFIGIDSKDRQKIIAYCNKKQLIIKRRSKVTG